MPSNTNGVVTTATVSAPFCRAISAITGTAPEPVPPPSPAVMTTKSEPATARPIWSVASRAATSPAPASPPVPTPLVMCLPIATLVRADERWRARASVFTTMYSTPLTRARIMASTAFAPPPPTPTTRILRSWPWPAARRRSAATAATLTPATRRGRLLGGSSIAATYQPRRLLRPGQEVPGPK